MKAYGIDQARNKGHKYAEDDVSTKGWFRTYGSSKRRKAHKRVYKKLERVATKREIMKEDE